MYGDLINILQFKEIVRLVQLEIRNKRPDEIAVLLRIALENDYSGNSADETAVWEALMQVLLQSRASKASRYFRQFAEPLELPLPKRLATIGILELLKVTPRTWFYLRNQSSELPNNSDILELFREIRDDEVVVVVVSKNNNPDEAKLYAVLNESHFTSIVHMKGWKIVGIRIVPFSILAGQGYIKRNTLRDREPLFSRISRKLFGNP